MLQNIYKLILICFLLTCTLIYYRLYKCPLYIRYYSRYPIIKERIQMENDEILTHEYCKNIGFDLRHFLINREKHIVFCWLHKVASTAVISQFSRWSKRLAWNSEQLHRQLNGLTARNPEEALDPNIGTRYILVRHPFTRLVSAYRDRILASYEGKYTYQAKKWGPAILGDRGPLLKVVALRKNGTLKRAPSFRKFIRWIIRSDGHCLDPHWGRYWEYCRPDLLPYDKIIHLEDLSPTKSNWKATCLYFQEISRLEAETLYQIYKRDFEIFNYSPNFFYNCTLN